MMLPLSAEPRKAPQGAAGARQERPSLTAASSEDSDNHPSKKFHPENLT